MPASDILELFGQFFFEFCVESGYDRILTVLGSTTKDFLQNLDALHDHLSTIYPGNHNFNSKLIFLIIPNNFNFYRISPQRSPWGYT